MEFLPVFLNFGYDLSPHFFGSKGQWQPFKRFFSAARVVTVTFKSYCFGDFAPQKKKRH